MWQTPKTDWYGSVDANGHYEGDRFNAVDFNRIKNNLEYLREMAIKMYKEFSIVTVPRLITSMLMKSINWKRT